MKKYQSNKRIDLTNRDQYLCNSSSRFTLKSLPKMFSNSQSSKQGKWDNSEYHECATDRSRSKIINQFNPLLSAYQSPKNIKSKNIKCSRNNIETFVRFRPICKSNFLKTFDNNYVVSSKDGLTTPQTNLSNQSFLKYNISQDQRAVSISINPDQENNFKFTKIFKPESTQDHVYRQVVKQLVEKFIKGFNATIFAYGQTGSGKTYTMLGNNIETVQTDKKGIMLHAISDLFANLKNLDQIGRSQTNEKISNNTSTILSIKNLGIQYPTNGQGQDSIHLSCSMLEIYKQSLIDLLCEPDKSKELKIKQSYNKDIEIDGLTIMKVTSQEQILALIKKGNELRKIRGTDANDHSSRSHLIFTIYLKVKIDQCSYKISKFNFVDLAGSQKVSKTKVDGEGLEEAKKINLSLSCLSNTINALSKGQEHIPFRDSKLTRILQESLSGNSLTRVIITCSILQNCKEQTISSLKFGNRIKKIKLESSENYLNRKNNLENSVDKYVYTMLLNSYQQSQEKLSKIRQIVVSSRNTKNLYNHENIVESVCKVISQEENQCDKTNLPQRYAKSINEQMQIVQSKNISLKNSKYAKNTDQSIEKLLQEIQQKQQIILQKQKIIVGQAKQIKRLQKFIPLNQITSSTINNDKKTFNKLKIVKAKKNEEKKCHQKNKGIQVNQQEKQNNINNDKMKMSIKNDPLMMSDISNLVLNLMEKVEKFSSTKSSFLQIQVGVLEKQIQILVNGIMKPTPQAINLKQYYQSLQSNNLQQKRYTKLLENTLIDKCYQVIHDLHDKTTASSHSFLQS